MFNTLFVPRNRNISGEVLDIHSEPRYCLSVSYWGNMDGEVFCYQRPQSNRFLEVPIDQPLSRVSRDVCVTHIFNMKPGECDFWSADDDAQWSDRIRRWPFCVEVEPVVVNERSGLPVDCPLWFKPMLQQLQSSYVAEAEAFRRLIGDSYAERVLTLVHPLIRAVA